MAEKNKSLLIIGCFDTKGEDFNFLRDCILAQGEAVLTINVGVLGTTTLFPVNVEADQVAAAAGQKLTDLRQAADRGAAVKVMADGAAKLIAGLVAQGEIKGAIGIGGGGGTYMALSAMQSIPFGMPKFCLSTVAAKDLTAQVKTRDITLMPSVVDIAGLNSMSKHLMRQAAAAVCAMAKVAEAEELGTRGRIAISMFGNTSVCVDQCSELLRNQGYEVLAFHANGIGGQTMESLIAENYFDAVLDVTTTELADDLCGGVCSAGPSRLTAASVAGIPQLIVPGCMDMVNFSHPDTVPEKYKNREFYSWAPNVTLMRTNEEENRILGQLLVERVQASSGPVAIALPLRGVSQIDSAGSVFWRPEIDQVLFEQIRSVAGKTVPVIEIDQHINDGDFSAKIVAELITMLDGHRQKKSINSCRKS